MHGKPNFEEGYLAPDHDPLDSRHVDFDWDDLFSRLREEPDVTPDDLSRAAVVLKAVFRWMVSGERRKGKRFGKTAARRLVALLWALDPAYFDESPSLSELARTMGVHKEILSRHSSDVAKRFNISNRFQFAHDWRKSEKRPQHQPHEKQTATQKNSQTPPPAKLKNRPYRRVRSTRAVTPKAQNRRVL